MLLHVGVIFLRIRIPPTIRAAVPLMCVRKMPPTAIGPAGATNFAKDLLLWFGFGGRWV